MALFLEDSSDTVGLRLVNASDYVNERSLFTRMITIIRVPFRGDLRSTAVGAPPPHDIAFKPRERLPPGRKAGMKS